ncbi:hypothetical protein IQ266_25415 [filamentous cyanobacterium LEGE 11480]|uniref:Uncharacterized protein n=1 Tax=Romeriopsis navalis LEGE 11480 TaxID=2777977 RepID=A0A928VR12_9CYAN|nr:hypothetical protein [Romeriopsis navalis]MBE9033081.1 hypothetical protein [Romeriopsis navalis LEGE 11480]
MAQSLEQINQSLKKLEQQAIDLGEKLHVAHQGYRNVLAQTANDQLIMSSFTLCTEAYPEEFLQLSVSERHQLQTTLRGLAKQLQTDLREVPSPQTPIEELAPSTNSISLPEMLALPSTESDLSEAPEPEPEVEEILILDEEDELDDGLDEAVNPGEQRGQQIEAELKALFSLESLLSQSQPQLPQNPVEQVSFWNEQVDRQASQFLRQVSAEINRLMQKSKILPGQIPAPILEAAALAESGEGFGKTPHLVRMVLEAREKPRSSGQDDRDSKPQRRRRDRQNSRPSAVVTIVTLQLRMAELEFHDTNLISWRNQIRSLLKELKTISKEYKKQQQKQAIANAKMTWRSTWSND